MANSTTLYTGQDGRIWVDVTEAKTLVAADSGIVQNVLTDAINVTLPATVVGHAYTIRNGGVKITTGAPTGAVGDATALVTVKTTGTDGVTGGAISAATSKGLLNTKATAKVGDECTFIGTGVNSAVAWVTTGIKGIWAREA